MKKNKLFLFLLCLILVFSTLSFAGCTKEKEPVNVDKETQDYNIKLYFANDEYVLSGDESLEKFFVSESKLNAKPGEVYADTLDELKTSPKEGYDTAITESIIFNDVYVEKKTAYVDISSTGLNGGSLTETILVGQIVNTLLESFDEVEQVQFLVDGEVAETLMGHMDTAKPFTEDFE